MVWNILLTDNKNANLSSIKIRSKFINISEIFVVLLFFFLFLGLNSTCIRTQILYKENIISIKLQRNISILQKEETFRRNIKKILLIEVNCVAGTLLKFVAHNLGIIKNEISKKNTWLQNSMHTVFPGFPLRMLRKCYNKSRTWIITEKHFGLIAFRK